MRGDMAALCGRGAVVVMNNDDWKDDWKNVFELISELLDLSQNKWTLVSSCLSIATLILSTALGVNNFSVEFIF